jgi:hypothetical protein
MTKIILTIFFAVLISQVFGQSKPTGTFIGLEKMKDYRDPAKPNYKWFHLSIITFKGDSVFLNQAPIAIYKTDTIFSASDGGFYTYIGTIIKYKGTTFADLTLVNCDYCPTQVINFTPPRIVKDQDTIPYLVADTLSAIDGSEQFDNPAIKFKIMSLQTTKTSNIILVNKNIYRRQKRK